jgi:FAD/FMN-containing dehydrogenase
VVGGAPAFADAAHLELTGLSGPVEINAENLSATFLAGTSIAEIDAALAPHGLWWPVDAGPDRMLGAVLATGGPYPGRTGYGYVRDWVLGLEVVLAGGERMLLGGQTMKNVAGYDLTRLLVGSRGTLGVIVAATLRLRPRPELMVTLRLPRERLSSAAGPAAACEWDGGQLLVRLDGREAQVARRLAALGDVAGMLKGDVAGVLAGDVPEVLAGVAARDAWAVWYARASGRYVPRPTPDWSAVGAPLLGLWRTDTPPSYSPLAEKIREAIAPGRCFNPSL